jgi:hypothetical protein
VPAHDSCDIDPQEFQDGPMIELFASYESPKGIDHKELRPVLLAQPLRSVGKFGARKPTHRGKAEVLTKAFAACIVRCVSSRFLQAASNAGGFIIVHQ